ncbi:hypothetical protein A9Q84_10315 [Halobacteriovorax marinus]|uniref:Peptidase M48 domain-containing protein n=1 Tax=Halobacteriovorax marinus TaxID=97084 RepID=A0A1Y5F745_9BACT|nr:hypothetical protein A9Q84_10315 [Halobacteriovorax marinus]
MKILLLFLLSIQVNASFNKSSSLTTNQPVIPKREFFKILTHLENEFQYLAKEQGEVLNILGGWSDRSADMAFARRWDTAQVLIFRGMAHRRELDRDALILIICHEIGHLYGGTPYSNLANKLSLEGQADYFATQTCLPHALLSYKNENLEKRIDQAMLNVGKFLANNRRINHPSFDTPDTTQVEQMLRTHPEPQCRLDTYVAGLYSLGRPACWFREN